MPRILLTAFEPYDCWPENSSWLALIEFTKRLDAGAKVTTRLYPTDLAAAAQRLEDDLAGEHDYVLHLGQAPGAAQLRLEAIGVNVATESAGHPDQVRTLVPDGPVAYRSQLPLAQWAEMLRQAGIPASVSYHAGTYLCNAILYLSHYYVEQRSLPTQVAFIHVPLDTSQVARVQRELPALPTAVCAEALRIVVGELVRRGRPAAPGPA